MKPLSDHDRKVKTQVYLFGLACLVALIGLSFLTQRATLYLLIFVALIVGQTALIRRADNPDGVRDALAPSGHKLAIGGLVVMGISAALYLAAA